MKIYDKYFKHFCKFMGTYTFELSEITHEIMMDFAHDIFDWNCELHEEQVIFFEREEA